MSKYVYLSVDRASLHGFACSPLYPGHVLVQGFAQACILCQTYPAEPCSPRSHPQEVKLEKSGVTYLSRQFDVLLLRFFLSTIARGLPQHLCVRMVVPFIRFLR